MTTYDWPNTRAFVPQRSELRVIDNLQRVSESPLSGAVQVAAMPGARWGWSDDFAPQLRADRDALEAYLLRLRGRLHKVRRWDHKRPQPRGSIVLSGVTVNATAAQFSSVLQLSNCRHPRGLLLNSRFENDDDSNGMSNGLVSYSIGSLSGLGFNRMPGAYQRVAVSTLGSTSTDRAGISFTQAVPVTAGADYVASAYMLSTAGTQHALEIPCYSASDVYLGNAGYSTWAGNSSFSRRALVFTPLAGAAKIYVYAYMHSASVSAPELWLGAMQVEPGTVATEVSGPASLLAGDWMGLPSQLVRVVADAQANDAGVMTVQVEHMLRQSVAAGSAVVLDRPTTTYRRTEAGLVVPRTAGMVDDGFSAEWVEDWS